MRIVFGVVGGVLVVFGLLGFAHGAFFSYVEAHQGYWQTCDLRGATEGLPPDVSIDAFPESSFAFWPLGVACDWPRDDGTIFTSYESDWGPTAWVYGLIGAGAVGVGLLTATAISSTRHVPGTRAQL